MTPIALTTCAVIFAGTAYAGELKLALAPEQGTLTSTDVGCPNEGDVVHLGQLFDQKNIWSATLYSAEHCPTILKAGTQVFIDKIGSGQFSKAACVRPEGYLTCVWTFASLIEQ